MRADPLPVPGAAGAFTHSARRCGSVWCAGRILPEHVHTLTPRSAQLSCKHSAPSPSWGPTDTGWAAVCPPPLQPDPTAHVITSHPHAWALDHACTRTHTSSLSTGVSPVLCAQASPPPGSLLWGTLGPELTSGLPALPPHLVWDRCALGLRATLRSRCGGHTSRTHVALPSRAPRGRARGVCAADAAGFLCLCSMSEPPALSLGRHLRCPH